MRGTAAGRRHRGNKQSLPSKPCQHCGLPMSWRKAWARHWDEVRYCSEACRRGKRPRVIDAVHG